MPKLTRCCAIYSPTAAMAGQNCAGQSRRSGVGPCRSSSAPTQRRALRSFPEDGWSSAHSHGSDAVVAWRRTARKPSPAPKHGSSSPTSAASSACWQGHDITQKVSNRTLRLRRPGDPARQRRTSGAGAILRPRVRRDWSWTRRRQAAERVRVSAAQARHKHPSEGFAPRHLCRPGGEYLDQVTNQARST